MEKKKKNLMEKEEGKGAEWLEESHKGQPGGPRLLRIRCVDLV